MGNNSPWAHHMGIVNNESELRRRATLYTMMRMQCCWCSRIARWAANDITCRTADWGKVMQWHIKLNLYKSWGQAWYSWNICFDSSNSEQWFEFVLVWWNWILQFFSSLLLCWVALLANRCLRSFSLCDQIARFHSQYLRYVRVTRNVTVKFIESLVLLSQFVGINLHCSDNTVISSIQFLTRQRHEMPANVEKWCYET